jgi:hypothetical protein
MNYVKRLMWIPAGALSGFLVSFIFGDLLTLPVDLYYLIYFVVIIVFFPIYIKKTKLNLKEWFLRRIRWGIVLGVIFGALMVRNVLSRPETETFSGLYLGWLIFWRGLIYGAIDGLFLSVFPWSVVWQTFDVGRKPLGKKIAFGFLAWVFILVMTAAYHLGYFDFRSKKLIQSIIGNTLISLPTLISASPAGSPIAHAAMHVAAVIHSPKTDVFLPPHRE